MGLCQCPKRKVTPLFCYEHSINVCEYCVVLNHPRCVVKSYLLWLQDSDYCPKCAFCQNELILAECVRLSCFHLYHWHCLDQHVREMPATTAPAGYKCVQCNEPIIPNSVNASPVVDALRDKLSMVNWGRIGLGLPLRAEEEILSLKQKSLIDQRILSSLAFEESMNTEIKNSIDDVVVHIEETTSQPRPEESARIPRRNPGNEKTSNEKTMLIDEDENKYKRRNDPELFLTYGATLWYKLFDYRSASRRDIFCWKKTLLVVFLLILFLIMLKIFSVYLTGEDSNFDVYANPNVHVNND